MRLVVAVALVLLTVGCGGNDAGSTPPPEETAVGAAAGIDHGVAQQQLTDFLDARMQRFGSGVAWCRRAEFAGQQFVGCQVYGPVEGIGVWLHLGGVYMSANPLAQEVWAGDAAPPLASSANADGIRFTEELVRAHIQS